MFTLRTRCSTTGIILCVLGGSFFCCFYSLIESKRFLSKKSVWTREGERKTENVTIFRQHMRYCRAILLCRFCSVCFSFAAVLQPHFKWKLFVKLQMLWMFLRFQVKRNGTQILFNWWKIGDSLGVTGIKIDGSHESVCESLLFIRHIAHKLLELTFFRSTEMINV